MRPKVVAALLLAVVVVLGTAVLAKRHPTAPATVAAAAQAPASPADTSSTPVPVPIRPAAAVVMAPPPSPEEHQAAIDAEVNRLSDLTGKHDAASMSIIMSDLTSPDKDVRLAAVEAVKQSDDPDVIPALRTDAASAPDLETQNALAQAADFLALPDAQFAQNGSGSGTPESPEQIQAIQQKVAAAQAQQQNNPQSHHLGQTSPAVPAATGN